MWRTGRVCWRTGSGVGCVGADMCTDLEDFASCHGVNVPTMVNSTYQRDVDWLTKFPPNLAVDFHYWTQEMLSEGLKCWAAKWKLPTEIQRSGQDHRNADRIMPLYWSPVLERYFCLNDTQGRPLHSLSR